MANDIEAIEEDMQVFEFFLETHPHLWKDGQPLTKASLFRIITAYELYLDGYIL